MFLSHTKRKTPELGVDVSFRAIKTLEALHIVSVTRVLSASNQFA